MSDLSQILAELRELREIVQSLQSTSGSVTHVCKGVTGKGGPCRNKSVPGGEYCRMHGEKPEKPVKVPKPKKVRKVQPEHTHGDGEVCILCSTHGDVLDPGLPNEMFESPKPK